NPRLGDGGGLLFGGGAEVEVDLVELGGKQIESLLRRVGEVKQVQVGWRDHAPLGQRLKVDDLLPVGAPIEQDHDPFAEFLRLHQREDFHQFVQRAEAAGKRHQRLGQVGEPKLAHEKVMEL